jgi:hemolysin III
MPAPAGRGRSIIDHVRRWCGKGAAALHSTATDTALLTYGTVGYALRMALAPHRSPDSETHRDSIAEAAQRPITPAEPPSDLEGEQIPTASTHPFAPRSLTRQMARRAKELGLALPKPRLRGVLHMLALPAALIAGLLLVALGHDLPTRLACAVFVLTSCLLFGVSATYHRGTWRAEHALMLRRFDHANIFLIIAGTYTPIAASMLQPRSAVTLLVICWAGALIGVGFRIFWTGAPRWLYVPAYVALGWVAIFYMPQIIAGGGWAVAWLIIAGGIAYTLGALVYGLKRPDPSPAWFGYHEIFHACTIAGFACHFVAVAIAVI